jgi:hypothetical protein
MTQQEELAEKLKQFTSASSNIGEIKKSLEEGMNVMLPFLQKLGDDQQKLANPKDRKVIKFNGHDVLVSLTIDGRILLQFDTLNDAQQCYDVYDAVSDEKEEPVEEARPFWKIFSKK